MTRIEKSISDVQTAQTQFPPPQLYTTPSWAQPLLTPLKSSPNYTALTLEQIDQCKYYCTATLVRRSNLCHVYTE